MRPDVDVTSFSAMFTQMAYQWSHTRRRPKRQLEPFVTAGDRETSLAHQDEASIRAEMEAALERRRLRQTRPMRRGGRRT
jgi:hypothetical protein